jgi:hypothetical protein
MSQSPVSADVATAPPPRSDPLFGERGYRFRWMVMAVVILADVMDLLDATIATLPARRSAATSGVARARFSGSSRRTP